MTNTSKTLLMLSAIVCGLLALFFYKNIHPRTPVIHQSQQLIKIHGVLFPVDKPVMPFEMISDINELFTEKNLLGHWSLLFFGFTNCGFVCPTTLSALNTMMTDLKKQLKTSELPQVVFISVDPERDTLTRLHEYVKSFNPDFIGVRAPLSVTQSVEKQFHIASVKIENNENPTSYSVNHSADIMVINPKGELAALLAYPHEPKALSDDYLKIIR